VRVLAGVDKTAVLKRVISIIRHGQPEVADIFRLLLKLSVAVDTACAGPATLAHSCHQPQYQYCNLIMIYYKKYEYVFFPTGNTKGPRNF